MAVTGELPDCRRWTVVNDDTTPSDSPNLTSAKAAEIARRIETRYRQLGLSQEEVASRAGMSVPYATHLLALGTDFDPAALLRLAAVLQMTYAELIDGRADAPPGQAPPAPHPMLMTLSERECWDRLGTHGIGRLGIAVSPGPVVLPVNYLVDGTSVVYRTTPDGVAAVPEGGEVSFEVDRTDEHRRNGWSVLVMGRAEHITDPGTVGELSELPGAQPWAAERRDLWIRILPVSVTGRLIRT